MAFFGTLLAGGLKLLKLIPWQVWAIAALVGSIWIGSKVVGQMVDNARNEGRVSGYAAGMEETRTIQAEADKIERARVAKITKAQEAITKGSSDAFTSASDAIDRRAAAIRVQHDADLAHRAATGRLYLPSVPLATGEPEATPACDGLSFDVALPTLTEAERNTAQLTAVLDWFEKQERLAAGGE
jgi:hypothetical protein